MRLSLVGLALVWAACNDTSNPQSDNEGELLTTVVLTFTPVDGGEAVIGRWADPELDGDPELTGITLQAGTEYTLAPSFLDEASSPPEEITEEIADEAEAHQIFYTGNAIDGPATGDRPDAPAIHEYDDTDSNGLPIGLANRITTRAPGGGQITVTLRHMPEEDGTFPKTADLAAEVATSGFGTVPGDNDVQVTLDLSVQ